MSPGYPFLDRRATVGRVVDTFPDDESNSADMVPVECVQNGRINRADLLNGGTFRRRKIIEPKCDRLGGSRRRDEQKSDESQYGHRGWSADATLESHRFASLIRASTIFGD